MTEPLVRLENIYKTYRMGSDEVPVLRGVNLDVHEGEFVAIMGSSGSGKSTLLHIAGALDQPGDYQGPIAKNVKHLGFFSPPILALGALFEAAFPARKRFWPEGKGDVYFRGNAISRMGLHARHRLRNQSFGFVFQFYHLLPELNVLENVLLPAMVEAPFYKAFIRARPRKDEALKLIDAFGLMPRIKHRPAQLSGGERQRVAIARALINQPALLLADEPTGNLDAKTGRTILDVLVKLHKDSGQTMLLVTHDPAVAALADRTVHLVEGCIK